MMLISANNITVTDTVVSDNSATIDPNKVCYTVESLQPVLLSDCRLQPAQLRV